MGIPDHLLCTETERERQINELGIVTLYLPLFEKSSIFYLDEALRACYFLFLPSIPCRLPPTGS